MAINPIDMFNALWKERRLRIKQDTFNKIEESINNKHPKADISYTGRYMPFSKIRLDIPVQNYLNPNDFVIKNDVVENNLVVTNPLKCNDEILNIYKHTRTKSLNPYRYEYDDITLGVPEFWMFPFELRVKTAGDCDDWGNELASYLLAAGVPSFRVRCVCGMVKSGQGGHHTVYVLGDDMKTWYHLNSTTPISMITAEKLTDLPTSKDENDSIGIGEVWFSYNDKYSWHEFETRVAATGFNKNKAMKFIKIVQKRQK